MFTTSFRNAFKLLAAALATASLGCLSAVPAAAQSLPSYATGSADETIHGTIASIDGQYRLSVRDARGYIDNVSLHRGTIINPTGLRLARGQSVTIEGRANGNTFDANEIDTPYESVAALPLFPAYGYFGYPFRGYGYGYGFAPPYSVGIGFGRGFGFHGW